MNKVLSAASVILGSLLLVAGWAIIRLVDFHENKTEWITFIDGPSAAFAQQALECRVRSRRDSLNISDYSYNVTGNLQPSGLYRYKSNLDALPPVDVHVLLIQGGSGRVVVEDAGQPVWLVLLSTQAAIWHVDLRPGAAVERVITNVGVSEIRFSRSVGRSASSVVDLLSSSDPAPTATPAIDVLPRSNCLVRLARFQEFEERRQHEAAILSLRAIVGHPESSLQSADSPSYFDRPFFVPFEAPDISPARLADVLRLADPLEDRERNSTQANAVRTVDALASEFDRYVNMPRNENTIPKTLASPAAFVSLLEEYQRRDLLPSSLPTSQPGSRGLAAAGWHSLADFRGAYRREVPEGVTPDACNGGRDRAALIIEGGNSSNIVKCAWGNQLYFMRGGDDEIDDSWQDDIINAGPGNDKIDAGWGNDLIFFNYGWGQDTVEKTCTGAAYVPQDTPRASTIRWSQDWPYKNFLVFGKDIGRDDIVVVGDKLVHRQTGDSIEIRGNCFNLVFWQ